MASGDGEYYDDTSSGFFPDDLDQQDNERDLYAILHINKDANATTIQQAYRRLTLLYHPDKHIDPRNKQLAMDLFIQVKKAYDILNDPQKRAIYDVVGMKGLKAEGWEIVSRTKTAREILEEYERLAREREERRFNQITNPSGSVNMTINLTDIFDQMNSSDNNSEFSPMIEMTEFTVVQGIDLPLTSQDTATITAVGTTRNGRGSGSLTTSFRRVLADLSWFRIDLSFGQHNLAAFRYFRRLTQKLQASIAATFGLVDGSSAIATPGFVFSITYQLSHHLTSSLQWKTGADSFMKGGLHYDNQKLAVSTALQLGFVNTFGAIDGVYRFPNICNLQCSFKMFIFGPLLEYGIDRQITKYTHGSATVAISSKMGVLLRLKFIRGSQTFTFPLQLSQDIIPSAIFYATIAPVLGYLILDRLVIRPYNRFEQEREQKKREDEAREKQTERRREAMNAQEVLRSLVEQIKEKEGSHGLIILEARYGLLTSSSTINENLNKIIDVTVPLQILVKDSTLRIGTTVSKSNLTGFYDPCIGEEKFLFIKYSLRSQIHTVIYKDTDPVILPNRDHLVQ
jgi:DnaJ family protein C protein 11